jgi:hypothetical protein
VKAVGGTLSPTSRTENGEVYVQSTHQVLFRNPWLLGNVLSLSCGLKRMLASRCQRSPFWLDCAALGVGD